MTEVSFGPAALPRLLCGTSPFMGAGQFGLAGREWYRRFFNHPDRMSEMFVHFCKLGYPGVHVTAYPTVIEAARITKESQDLRVAISLLPENWERNLEETLVLDPEVVFVHGAMTDRFLDRRLEDLRSCFEAIRAANAFPGLATHDTCNTLRVLQSDDNPLQDEAFGLLLPVNKTGYSVGGSTTEMEQLLQSLDVRNPVMGMKVLAAGKLPPQEALEYAFSLPRVRAVTVGVTERWQAAQLTEIMDSIQSASVS
ncbi:MAG: hypothetical protein ACFE8Z_05135 [Candidatus Hermodarchaeota archaeon]